MLNSFNCFLTMTLMGPLQLFILGALLFPNIQSRWTAEIKQKDRKKVCVPLCMLLVETSSVNQISLVLCFSFHPKAIRGELLLEIRAVLLCFDGNMRPILITRPNISLSLSLVLIGSIVGKSTQHPLWIAITATERVTIAIVWSLTMFYTRGVSYCSLGSCGYWSFISQPTYQEASMLQKTTKRPVCKTGCKPPGVDAFTSFVVKHNPYGM